jgi:hypothetical protein
MLQLYPHQDSDYGHSGAATSTQRVAMVPKWEPSYCRGHRVLCGLLFLQIDANCSRSEIILTEIICAWMVMNLHLGLFTVWENCEATAQVADL